jgi:hypothetical protein
MWIVIAKISISFLLLIFSIDLFKRGIEGITTKQIFIYRWTALLNEYCGSLKVLDKKSGRWINSDTRGVRGIKAVVFGVVYILLSLLLISAATYSYLFL